MKKTLLLPVPETDRTATANKGGIRTRTFALGPCCPKSMARLVDFGCRAPGSQLRVQRRVLTRVRERKGGRRLSGEGAHLIGFDGTTVGSTIVPMTMLVI